jgi:uncharacterized protein
VKGLDSTPLSFYNLFMIEKMIRIGRLYYYYGDLLTERQQKCLDLHYLQDLSLGEIAAELGVSRQAINDILHRAEETLEHYESVLKMMDADDKRTETLQSVRAQLIKALQADHPLDGILRNAVDEINGILEQKVGIE